MPANEVLSPDLFAFLAERRLPTGLDDYLASLGVHSLGDFIAINGDAWESAAAVHPPGRALAAIPRNSRVRRMHQETTVAPPRVLIYPDTSNLDLLRPGASRRAVGPRLRLHGNASELAGYPSLYDNSVLLAPIRDALRGYPRLVSAECTGGNDDAVDLFLSFVQPAVTPLYDGMGPRERVRWKKAHPEEAAQCSEAGRDKLRRRFDDNWTERECLDMVRAQQEECSALRNASQLTRLRPATARRHFVLTLGGSARGVIFRSLNHDGGALCGEVPPLALRLVYDEPVNPESNPERRLMVPVLSNIRWSSRVSPIHIHIPTPIRWASEVNRIRIRIHIHTPSPSLPFPSATPSSSPSPSPSPSPSRLIPSPASWMS